jgi:formamidase
VAGAKFSVGDLHFSQGDGEISFCGAIEMAGVITINFKVIKNGLADLGIKSPIYIPGPVEPQFGPGRYIYFEGFSVDHHGKQRMLCYSPLVSSRLLSPQVSNRMIIVRVVFDGYLIKM